MSGRHGRLTDEQETPDQQREPEPVPQVSAARQLASTLGNQAFMAVLRQPVQIPPELTLKPPPDPYQGPFSPAPRDTHSFVEPAVEREWTAELRRQAGNRMDRAFTKYSNAITRVREELKDKKAESSLLEQLLLVAVGALAPGVAGMVLAKFKDELKVVASLALDKGLGNTDTAVKAYMKAEELVDKYIALDGDKAKAGLGSLLTAMKASAGPVMGGSGPSTEGSVPTGGQAPVGGGGMTDVPKMLEQFSQTFSVYIQNLDQKLGTLDRAGVLGVWAAFDANVVTEAFYMAQIKDLVKMHEELGKVVADPTRGFGGSTHDYDMVIMLEAWGTVAPAYVRYHPGSLAAFTRGHWDFNKWVPAEMASTAIAAGATQKQALGSKKTLNGLPYAKAGEPFAGTGLAILGHIDNPQKEGERVAEVSGKLAYVQVGFDGTKLIRYVEGGEAEYAKIKGQRQPGGIDKIEAASLKK